MKCRFYSEYDVINLLVTRTERKKTGTKNKKRKIVKWNCNENEAKHWPLHYFCFCRCFSVNRSFSFSKKASTATKTNVHVLFLFLLLNWNSLICTHSMNSSVVWSEYMWTNSSIFVLKTWTVNAWKIKCSPQHNYFVCVVWPNRFHKKRETESQKMLQLILFPVFLLLLTQKIFN